MIAVDRERRDATGGAIHPRRNWDTRARAATVSARYEAKDHDARADVYADSEVRAALEELFHWKCAYCGGDIASATWDVEHFRPKGRVHERPEHPGYYWLTYAWSNLYAACQYCNQHRRDKPTWGEPTEGPAAGKLDQFPLADESTRAMEPEDNLGAEDRLLIDPCEDDPEDYLGYEPNGQIFAIRSAPRGETSIDVYALRRKRLVEQRREVWDEAVELLRVIQRAEDAGVSEVAASARKTLQRWRKRGKHAGVVRFVEKNREVFLD